MPLSYKIIDEQKLIFVVGSGVVTADEILNHLENLAVDEGYEAPMKKLVDYRTIESISISQDEASAIARSKKTHLDRFAGEKCAFVSPGDLTYGTARVHQALIDSADIDTHVFRNIQEAREWLDLGPEVQ